jgi:pilus assembly protein Flp/PilA
MRDFIMNLVARLQVEREDGQAMVEYGLILALVSVVSIAILGTMGGQVTAVFTSISNALPAS